MQPLHLLLAGGTNRDEFRGSSELLLVRLEFGLRGQVLRLRVSQLRAEHLQQRLTAPHLVAELHEHPRHASGDERRDDDLFVGIGFDGSWDAHRRRAGGASRDRQPVRCPLVSSPLATTSRRHRAAEDVARSKGCPASVRWRRASRRRGVCGARESCMARSTRADLCINRYVVPAPTASSAIAAAATDRPTERDSGIPVHRTSPSARRRAVRAS